MKYKFCSCCLVPQMNKILNHIRKPWSNVHTIHYNISGNINSITKSNLSTIADSFQEVSKDDNVYFILDATNKVKYVGKKQSGDGINYRLKLHLIKNNTQSTSSCIEEVINEIKKGNDIFHYITIRVEPNWMVPAVESYFIDYFKSLNPPQCDFVKRK